MDTTRRIAIVQHRDSLFPLDLRQAIGVDLEPIWVLADDDAADPALRRLLARTGRVVDVAGLDVARAAELVGAQDPQGIITGVDETLELTAGIAAALGLPYHSLQTARTVAEKGLQRAALARAEVPGPRFTTLRGELGPEALADAGRDIRYPSVLKPTAGTGGRGVRHLSGPEDLAATYRPDTPVVVEEYLPDSPERDSRVASYLSVESVVCDGRISHVALCGRFPLAAPYRESGFWRLVQPPTQARSVRSVAGVKQVSAWPNVDHVGLVRAA